MKVLVAFDSFKGSLSCVEATGAVAQGLGRVLPESTILQIPLADGGEGTLEAVRACQGGQIRTSRITGPLGRPVKGEWLLLKGGATAIIELAQAAGLTLVADDERDPAHATTYGVGELMGHAIDSGCSRIVLTVGGSATMDGGAGLLQALGARLLNRQGEPIAPGGVGLEELGHVDIAPLKRRLGAVELLVACDVDNPLCGPRGASMVFGPQKGADAALCQRLDVALDHYAECLARDVGVDPRQVPRAGAAGGTAGGLLAAAGARLVSGADLILEMVGFQQAVDDCQLIITGEGRVDGQTLDGKIISSVARAAWGKPLIVLAGQLAPGSEGLYDRGVSAMLSIVDGPMSLSMAMADAESLLVKAAERCGRFLALGRKLPRE